MRSDPARSQIRASGSPRRYRRSTSQTAGASTSWSTIPTRSAANRRRRSHLCAWHARAALVHGGGVGQRRASRRVPALPPAMPWWWSTRKAPPVTDWTDRRLRPRGSSRRRGGSRSSTRQWVRIGSRSARFRGLSCAPGRASGTPPTAWRGRRAHSWREVLANVTAVALTSSWAPPRHTVTHQRTPLSTSVRIPRHPLPRPFPFVPPRFQGRSPAWRRALACHG